MAILGSNEIRDMSVEEMEVRLAELKTELARERAVSAGGGSLENPGRVRELRRTIARILTIMKEVSGNEKRKEGGG